MCLLLLVSVTFVRYCSAWPAHHGDFQPDPLDSYSPSTGFPAQYLPINVASPYRSSTPDHSSQLKLPIIIPKTADFEVSYTDSFNDPPSGFELALTLVTEIYHYWRSDENWPIRLTLEYRREPFPQFLHTIKPSLLPGASLTPLKVGIGYCECLYHVITAQNWPGHITARIQTRDGPDRQKLRVGSINIDNATLTWKASDVKNLPDTGADGAANGSEKLSVPPTMEKQWLACYALSFFYFIRHGWSGKVTDDPSMTPKTTPTTYRFDCPHGVGSLLLLVYPAANFILTWDTLNKGMMSWLHNVAMNEGRYENVMIVREYDVTMAELLIQLPVGSHQRNVTATA